jgi:hypothetical protein
MSGEIAVQIVGIFLGLFVVIVALVLWFTRGMARDKNVSEVKKKQIDVVDKHFGEMTRVECPYCKTLYHMNRDSCPTCGADTKKISYPKFPE